MDLAETKREIIAANQPKNQHDAKEASQNSCEASDSHDRETDAKVGKVEGVSRKVHFSRRRENVPRGTFVDALGAGSGHP